MKLKIILLAAGIALVSSSAIVIMNQSRQSNKIMAPPQGGELPAAISNYSKTFKLNINPPLWTTPAHGRNATN